MPTTVGQHAVASFTSPVNGTSPIDATQVRTNDNTLRTSYVSHDADPGIHVQSSALASRPAAGVAGRKWMTVDGSVVRMWYDDGTNWQEQGSPNNVVGPASATDNAIARYDGTTGKLIQDSGVTLTPSGLSNWTMATPSSGALTVNATDGLMTLIGRGITLKAGAIDALVIRDATDSVDLLKADSDITISTLAGSGTRMVTATAAGLLGAAAIPTGDVVGPASATDNAIARFDGTTGKLVQNSTVTIDDNGRIVQSSTLNTAVSDLYGARLGVVCSVASPNTTDRVYGMEVASSLQNTGTVQNLYGVVVTLSKTAGTVQSAAGLRVTGLTFAVSTERIGVDIGSITGTGTNTGIKVGNVSGGTLNYAIYTGTGLVRFGDVVNTTSAYQVNGTQVVGAQGAAVADATDAASVIARLNDLLSRLRAHGLIAT